MNHRFSIGLCALAVLGLAFGSGPLDAELPEESARWNQPVEPFRIAGNLYYVGANEVTAYLFTTPEGHILLDGGFEETVPLIAESVESLGFRLEDVKILLNSHAHLDHAGGLAELKRLTEATLFASRWDAALLEAGGEVGYRFPAVRPDRLFFDGYSVELGGTVLTARVTPGHTPGCTTWTTEIEVAGESKAVVFVCGVNAFPSMDLLAVSPLYPDGRAQAFASAFEMLEGLPCDVFLGLHGSFFLLGDKSQAMGAQAGNPFVDPELYGRHVASKKTRFEEELARQKAAIAAREAMEVRFLGGPCRRPYNPDREAGLGAALREALARVDLETAIAVQKKIVRQLCDAEFRWFRLAELYARAGRFEPALEMLTHRLDEGSNDVLLQADGTSEVLANLEPLWASEAYARSALATRLERLRQQSAERRLEFGRRLATLPDRERPSAPYVAKQACPGEYCGFGEGKVLEDVEIFDRPAADRRIAIAPKGSRLVSLDGEVHVARPEAVGVRHEITVWPEHRIEAGEIVFVLDYLGEGFFQAMHRGELVELQITREMRTCSFPRENCWWEALDSEDDRKEAVWWVEVELPDGTRGWTHQTERFSRPEPKW